MKRLISAVLALTLLGATAASAQSFRGGYGHGGYGGYGGYSRGYGHGGGWHDIIGQLEVRGRSWLEQANQHADK